jgi:DNA-directed RNA polymerase subunit RPC12/RpoP
MSPQIHLSLPVEVHFLPTWGHYQIHRLGRKRWLQFIYEPSRQFGEKESWGPREDEYSPWEVRSDILSGDEFVDYETFVYFYGRFSVLGDIRCSKADPHGREDFREWQRLLGDLVRGRREDWPRLKRKYPTRKLEIALRPLPVNVEWMNGKAVGVITVRLFLEAVIASIQIDKLRGIASRYCAECRKEFSLTSKHERIYCLKTCAHRVAVRRYRERKRKNASIVRVSQRQNEVS